MKILTVKNFGPIVQAKVDLEKEYQIYIGIQASGKSTLCKLCYFFRKIRDYTLEFLIDSDQFSYNHKNEYFNNYLKYLTRNFMGCFGTTKHLKPFFITYDCEKFQIHINLKKGFVKFHFDDGMKKSLIDLFEEAAIVHEKWKNPISIMKKMEILANIRSAMDQRVQSLFLDDAEIVYIPAGRSLFAIISDKLQHIPLDSLDLTMKEFIQKITETKYLFGLRIPDMVQNYLQTVTGQIDNDAIKDAYDLIKNILKADYASENDGEKIYFDSEHWVKLMYSSSGQQEALWILMLCFLYILKKRKTFMIVEEPEAHLFPMAQKDIVTLIALMTNVTKSNIIVTTHSPYILTSANILLLSASIEKTKKIKKKNTPTIIKKRFRLNPNSFGAYLLVDGKPSDIVDRETNMIDIKSIDAVSEITNDEMVSLLDKEENNYDM